MRCWLQHPLVARNDPQKSTRFYLAMIKVLGLQGLLPKNSPINRIEQFRGGQLIALAV